VTRPLPPRQAGRRQIGVVISLMCQEARQGHLLMADTIMRAVRTTCLSGVIVRAGGRSNNRRRFTRNAAFAITGCPAFAGHDESEVDAVIDAVGVGRGNIV
jgi:hypothetical protein